MQLFFQTKYQQKVSSWRYEIIAENSNVRSHPIDLTSSVRVLLCECVHVSMFSRPGTCWRAPASLALLQHAEQQMRPQKQQALTELRPYYVTRIDVLFTSLSYYTTCTKKINGSQGSLSYWEEMVCRPEDGHCVLN